MTLHPLTGKNFGKGVVKLNKQTGRVTMNHSWVVKHYLHMNKTMDTQTEKNKNGGHLTSGNDGSPWGSCSILILYLVCTVQT